MPELSWLWVAARTKNVSNAGTDNSLVLIINQNGVDVLQEELPAKSGNSKLWYLDVQNRGIHVDELTNGSIRIGITGDDAWKPEHVLIWGQEDGGKVVPIAAEWVMETTLSTNASEGKLTFPLRRINFPTLNPTVGIPDVKAVIKQLLIIKTTADEEYAGSDEGLSGDFLYGDDYVWENQDLGSAIGRGKTSMLFPGTLQFPSPREPRWNNLKSLTIKIAGSEKWLPSSFFVFGFRHLFYEPWPGIPWESPPDSIMPLVFIRDWLLGPLSTKPSEGKSSVVVPCLPPPDISID